MKFQYICALVLVGALCVAAIQPADHENMRFGNRDRRQPNQNKDAPAPSGKENKEKPKDETRDIVKAALKEVPTASYGIYSIVNGAVTKEKVAPIADLGNAALAKDKFVVIVSKIDPDFAVKAKAAAEKSKQAIFIDDQYLVKKAERSKLPRIDHAKGDGYDHQNLLVIARFGLNQNDAAARAQDKGAEPNFKEDDVVPEDIQKAESDYLNNKPPRQAPNANGPPSAAPSAAPPTAAPPANLLQLSSKIKNKAASKSLWYLNRSNGSWRYWEDNYYNNIHFSQNTANWRQHHTKRDDRNFYFWGNRGGRWINKFNGEARRYASAGSLQDLSDAFDDWYA